MQPNTSAPITPLQEIGTPNIQFSEIPKKSNKILIFALALLVISLITGGFFTLAKTYLIKTNKSAESPNNLPILNKQAQAPNINLQTGFSFLIPADWTAKISDNSGGHFYGKFFVPGMDQETNYIEIESGPLTQLIENPTIEIAASEKKQISGTEATIISGKEKFEESQRKTKQAIFKTTDGKYLSVIAYFSKENNLENQFNSFIESITTNNEKQSFKLINTAFASEVVANQDKTKFKKIEVMGNPLSEKIVKEDAKYKDGYADFYYFEAFKGQRLTVVAKEQEQKSYILSDLFNESGQLLTNMNTRIEFETPYTGRYYLIIHSFKKQEGQYLLKVFDRNQTDNLIYIKYKDGTEKLLDPAKSPPLYGREFVSIVFQFISPVEILENNTVRYLTKPREFEKEIGMITTPIEVFATFSSYNDFIKQGSVLPEDNYKNKVAIKLTKLSPSRLLITVDKVVPLFPPDLHIVIVEQRIGRYRFFTEGKRQKPTIIPSPIYSPIPTGTCITEGNKYNSIENPRARCCAGLEARTISGRKDFKEECIAPTNGDNICVACGNNLCGKGETDCICPEDCPAPIAR